MREDRVPAQRVVRPDRMAFSSKGGAMDTACLITMRRAGLKGESVPRATAGGACPRSEAVSRWQSVTTQVDETAQKGEIGSRWR